MGAASPGRRDRSRPSQPTIHSRRSGPSRPAAPRAHVRRGAGSARGSRARMANTAPRTTRAACRPVRPARRVREVLPDGWVQIDVSGLSVETGVIGRAAPGWLPQSGASVKLAARPEDAQVTHTGEFAGDGVLHAVTRSALFLGDRYQVQVELENGAELMLHAPRTVLTTWAPDERVGVRLPPEAVMVWPA